MSLSTLPRSRRGILARHHSGARATKGARRGEACRAELRERHEARLPATIHSAIACPIAGLVSNEVPPSPVMQKSPSYCGNWSRVGRPSGLVILRLGDGDAPSVAARLLPRGDVGPQRRFMLRARSAGDRSSSSRGHRRRSRTTPGRPAGFSGPIRIPARCCDAAVPAMCARWTTTIRPVLCCARRKAALRPSNPAPMIATSAVAPAKVLFCARRSDIGIARLSYHNSDRER